MEYARFAAAAKAADLVITGEWMTDSQTAEDKLCSVIARECRRLGVPVALLSGALRGEAPGGDLPFAAANIIRAYRFGAAN
jgi:glycerate kinase